MHEAKTECHRRIADAVRHLFGGVILQALEERDTIEVLADPDGTVWQEKFGGELTPIASLGPEIRRGIIENVAGTSGKVVCHASPLLEGELLLDDSRFAGVLPPAAPAPAFSIRKKACAVFTLEDYEEKGIMSGAQVEALRDVIGEKRNIIVSGGTGSGKTTLLNAIIAEMRRLSPGERCLILQDTAEIQCSGGSTVFLYANVEVSMTKLVRFSLRMRPDRIFVGEVRGEESLDLLRAFNSGHEGGITTIHANGARDALAALEILVSMHRSAPRSIPTFIARACPVILQIVRGSERKRRVTEILSVEGYEDGDYLLSPLFVSTTRAYSPTTP